MSGTPIDIQRRPYVPNWSDHASFAICSFGLRQRHRLFELFRSPPPLHAFGQNLRGAPIIAQSMTPLWPIGGLKEQALSAGKVENLRVALRALNGLEIEADQVFSFWRQIGRPSRRRGFVIGRELREGCLIANVGGGLCQLSNALYEVALQAGFEIVERHAHSHIVPGSRAESGRDATVFWNYVDLRFRTKTSFRLEAGMSADRLLIALRARSRQPEATAPSPRSAPAANDCQHCAEWPCRYHNPETSAASLSTAWLLDACTLKFSAWFTDHAQARDALFLPTRRYGGKRYAWPKTPCKRETTATLAALRRSLSLRGFSDGGALQHAQMFADRVLAQSYARDLSFLDTQAVVAQNLLPHLWQMGVLQGRRFRVLMTRLPLAILQQRLDDAAKLYPQSSTLSDFRAPQEIVEADQQALAVAESLISPHEEILRLCAKAERIDWQARERLKTQKGGKMFLLPASSLARKGCYALREAMRALDCSLLILGKARETDDFWQGLDVNDHHPGTPLPDLAGVVLPAIVEHNPHMLLIALAAHIPVIASPACGLRAQEGLTLVSPYDADALREAMKKLLP